MRDDDTDGYWVALAIVGCAVACAALVVGAIIRWAVG